MKGIMRGLVALALLVAGAASALPQLFPGSGSPMPRVYYARGVAGDTGDSEAFPNRCARWSWSGSVGTGGVWTVYAIRDKDDAAASGTLLGTMTTTDANAVDLPATTWPYLKLNLNDPTGNSVAEVWLYCSQEARGGGGAGSTTVGSTGGFTTPLDWSSGVEAQMTTFIDDTLSYTYEYGPMNKGANGAVVVTTTYADQAALTAGVTCNVANLGRIEYVDSGSCDGPPDLTGICRCQNYDPVGAGADYAWREAWPVGEVWRLRTSGAAGASYVAVRTRASAAAHTPPWAFEMYHDTADACLQLEYLDGGNGNIATWGRLGATEQMLIQLGYLSVDAVHAFWGMTSAPSGVVINPAAASFTAALQNFTDGWFYAWWAETTTIEAGSRRASANSVQTVMTLSSGTDRGFWLTAHMKGWIATASLIEMIQPLAAATWNARFMAKLGYPFTMARHPSAAPPSTNWVSVTSSSNPPSNSTELRPVVALCGNTSVGSGAQLRFYKARMAIDVYDYD